MRHTSLRTLLTMAAAVVCFSLLGTEISLASGGGSWGGGSAGFGSGGSAGFGSGGSWGGRTPVRDFFAHRQPVRNLLRGVRDRFAYSGGSLGSRGWGSVGGGSTGYSGGSVGGGSIGSGSVGGGSVGGLSNGSAGYDYYSGGAGSTGSGFAYNTGYGSVASTYAAAPASTGCVDCVGGIGSVAPLGSFGAIGAAPGVPFGDSFAQDGSVIGSDGTAFGSSEFIGDQNLDPVGGFTDPNVGETILENGPSDGSSLRGFENPPSPTPEPVNGSETTSSQELGDSILTVNLPIDAKLFVNNRLTKTRGKNRSYVSRKLRHGKRYAYTLNASVVRDGKKIVLTKDVVLRAGKTAKVDFDFERPITTQLTVRVPENATVKLCGNSTVAKGTVRNFKTKLKPGKVWEDYSIDVTFDREGEKVTERRSLTIEAGEKYVVDFSNEKDLYAAR